MKSGYKIFIEREKKRKKEKKIFQFFFYFVLNLIYSTIYEGSAPLKYIRKLRASNINPKYKFKMVVGVMVRLLYTEKKKNLLYFLTKQKNNNNNNFLIIFFTPFFCPTVKKEMTKISIIKTSI